MIRPLAGVLGALLAACVVSCALAHVKMWGESE